MRESLRLLRTDRFDLYQLHGMSTQEDFDQRLGRTGLEAVVVAASTERDRVDAGLIEGGYSYIGVELATHIRDVRAGVKVLQPVTEAQLFS